MKADHKTGSSAKQTGDGAGQTGQQPGGEGAGKKSDAEQAKNAPPGAPAKNDGSSGTQPGGEGRQPGPQSAGNPTVGGQEGNRPASPPVVVPPPAGGDDPNLEYARKQTDLALDYLRDQMAKDKSRLLDQLGWSREDAARFLQRWEQMKQAAGRQGVEGQAARKSLDEAIKSLGLRPHGTRLRGGKTAQDKIDNLRDARRSEPPADWAEQVHDYLRGVATGGR